MSSGEWKPGDVPTPQRQSGLIRATAVGGSDKVLRPDFFGPDATEADVARAAGFLEQEYELREPLGPQLVRAFPTLNERIAFLKMLQYATYDADTSVKASDVLRGGVIRIELPEMIGDRRIEASFQNGVLRVAPSIAPSVRERVAFVLHRAWAKQYDKSDEQIEEN